MEFSEIWLAYLEDRLGPAIRSAAPVGFRASETLGRFFELHPMFTARWTAIQATRYMVEFEEAADGALCQVVLDDSFAIWEHLEAGVWRVLAERLLYCEMVLTLHMAREDRFIDSLPSGLTGPEQTKALLLKYLLGHGRTIDREVLPERTDGSLPVLPATLSLRPQ